MSDEIWHEVANADEVKPEEPIKVQIGDEEIALFHVDGDVYATSNICTHAFASMVDGYQEGVEIECPLHEGRFNIKTGAPVCPPVSEPLRTFSVKVENGKVLVKV